MNTTLLEEAGRLLLKAIGADSTLHPDLQDTPKRFAKMMEERLAYQNVSNKDIAEEFNKVFPCQNNDMVVMKDIDEFSFCEHHIALMYNMKIAIGYIPNGYVVGISKLARIANAVCRRLQLQEKIGADIYDVLRQIVKTDDIIVFIEGEHSCMTARGIKKPGAKTRTIFTGGRFKKTEAKKMFLDMVK